MRPSRKRRIRRRCATIVNRPFPATPAFTRPPLCAGHPLRGAGRGAVSAWLGPDPCWESAALAGKLRGKVVPIRSRRGPAFEEKTDGV